MKKENVIIIGSSNQAKLVIDILHEMDCYNIIGLTSENHESGYHVSGYKVLGNDSILDNYPPNDVKLVMGVGGYRNNQVRKKIFKRLTDTGYRFINAVHPFSSISKTCELGTGIVIYAGTVINTNAVIGNNCILALNSSVGHDTVIEDNVLLSAGTNIGADAKVGDSSLIAMGAKVVSGISIGKNVLMAAGSVAVTNIEDSLTVFGIPAKPKKIKND